MAKKKKKTVWHKRKGKFIPSSSLKPHHVIKSNGSTEERSSSKAARLKKFTKDLSAQIKKAAKDGS